MTPAAVSTTRCALAHSFTPGILQRLPDAESGLQPVVHSGAGAHIVRALLFSTIEAEWFHALGLQLNLQTMISFSSFRVVHVKRRANMAAHACARHAALSSFEVLANAPPSFLSQVLQDDCNRVNE